MVQDGTPVSVDETLDLLNGLRLTSFIIRRGPFKGRNAWAGDNPLSTESLYARQSVAGQAIR